MPTRRLIFALAIVAGCDDDGNPTLPDASEAPDAFVAPACTVPTAITWWAPKPGEAKNWDIQLAAPFDLATARAMYTLELFDVVPTARDLDYGDGTPVTVPAGARATAIADLHAASAKVVCRIATGALAAGDPDAAKFPAAAIGSVTGGPDTEKYLDIRATTRTTWLPVLAKRYELAKAIGCDAVLADRSDIFKTASGFDVTDADQVSFLGLVADQAHAMMLSVGLKNGFLTPEQASVMSPCYDWELLDRCAEFDDCDVRAPAFVAKMKAAFALDIQLPDSGGGGVVPAAACPLFLGAQADGIVKDEALTSTFREGCGS
ncbi:MAG: endo alpha-1,4 polygalactosaminidase [Kofleriaceae bacterium]